MTQTVDTVAVTMNVMLLEEKGLIKWNQHQMRYEPSHKGALREIIEALTDNNKEVTK